MHMNQKDTMMASCSGEHVVQLQQVDRRGPVRKVEVAGFLYQRSLVQIILDHELSQVTNNLAARSHLQQVKHGDLTKGCSTVDVGAICTTMEVFTWFE